MCAHLPAIENPQLVQSLTFVSYFPPFSPIPPKVPVLIFQLERNTAVLIDEHYNAKALEDMILVVQNAARE